MVKVLPYHFYIFFPVLTLSNSHRITHIVFVYAFILFSMSSTEKYNEDRDSIKEIGLPRGRNTVAQCPRFPLACPPF